MSPQHGRTLSQLLKHADLAMYRAKKAGRNACRIYDKGEGGRARRRAEIEAELRKAVHRGELELHYQPKIDLASRETAGVEALLRWNHPSLGAIAPGHFISVAEQSGLILPIGDWVLRTACVQSRAWADLGLPPTSIAVNFSPLQFEKPSIVEDVQEQLSDTGAHPGALELELTESMIIQNPEAVRSKLCRLKDLGISIALDDFGTGYSNLQYLRKLPIDTLKIDRSFVADTPFDTDAVAVARAVIALGRNLGFTVVAEGVENVGQAEFLASEACSLAQGFLFAAPMSARDCTEWLIQSSSKRSEQFVDRGELARVMARHRLAMPHKST
jgi:EAL domain-containing protein (putative c-di-GMP-specific phosphodiesterase class I)